MAQARMTVDGIEHADGVEPRVLLVQYLRERLGKTGTAIGCDTSNCGACTVSLDGQSVKSCSVLAVQADGGEVLTIEGLARGDPARPGGQPLPVHRVPEHRARGTGRGAEDAARCDSRGAGPVRPSRRPRLR